MIEQKRNAQVDPVYVIHPDFVDPVYVIHPDPNESQTKTIKIVDVDSNAELLSLWERTTDQLQSEFGYDGPIDGEAQGKIVLRMNFDQYVELVEDYIRSGILNQSKPEKVEEIIPKINIPKIKFKVGELFGKPKFQIGQTVGYPVDDDGETVYLEARIEDIVNQLENGQAVYIYYVKITEDQDWIPMGKKVFVRETLLSPEPSPLTASKHIGSKIMEKRVAQIGRDQTGAPTGGVKPTRTIEEAEQIVNQAGPGKKVTPPVEPAVIPVETEKKPIDRRQQVKDALQKLYKEVDDISVAIYQMKLTDPQLQELTGKVVNQISDTVSEITIQRVKDIAPELLGSNKK